MDCTCTTPATERVEIEADNNQADKVLSTFFEVKKNSVHVPTAIRQILHPKYFHPQILHGRWILSASYPGSIGIHHK
jgi:hypothetical protein